MDMFSRNRGGFTLMEMAVVLVVVGMISLAVVPALVSEVKRGKLDQARELLASAERQVLGYAMEHKGLPAADGAALDNRDPWQRPLDYYAAGSLAGPGAMNCDTPEVPDTTTLLRVVTPFEQVDNVAFVIRSRGHDPRAPRNHGYTEGAPPEFDASASGSDDLYAFMTYYRLLHIICREE